MALYLFSLDSFIIYKGDKVDLETDKDGKPTARNIYGINLLMRTVDDKTYYYMYNGHADVTALIDADGKVAASYYYDAFGNILESSGDTDNNIRYSGYQYDEETGLYYLNARMYDPETARFMQEDTYTGDMNDPLSLNLYTYCANNPIIYRDSSGHCYYDKNGNWCHDNWEYLDGYVRKPDPKSKDLVTLQNLDDFNFYMGSTASERKLNLAELNRILKKYDINTPLRIAFFLGEIAHESSFGSRTLETFNGNSPKTYFNKKYSNNSDIGNKGGNDGELFRGSGYIHITGRYNYQKFADYIGDQSIMTLGYELIGGVYNKPVSQIKLGEVGVIDVGKYAWESAGWFWRYGNPSGKNLNNLADNKDYCGVLIEINKYDTGSKLKRNSCINKIYEILTGSILGLPE